MESHLSPRSLAFTGHRRLESIPVEPLMTRDFDTRPALVYERLRQKYGPVAPVDVYGVPAWLVLGYQEVLEVLRNESIWKRNFDHWRALNEGQVPADWPLMAGQTVRTIMFRDDQQHRVARGALDVALKPFQDPAQLPARQLKVAITHHADQLISFFAEGDSQTGWVDLCAQYSRPLPLMVVNRLLGFPEEVGDEVFMDAWRMVDASPDAQQALERILQRTTELAARKMVEPGDDLPSRMIAADPTLTAEQVGLEMYMVLVITGETCGHAITNTVLEVVTGNAGARASVSDGMISEAVNRSHLASPPWTNLTFRYPVVDTKLGNYVIAAGDPVIPSIAGAHADPLFAGAISPQSTVSTRAHLAWGAGPHQCPVRGGVADMLVNIAVSRLFARCDGLELGLAADQLPWRSSLYVHGLRSMPLRFRLREMVADPQLGAGAAAEGAAGSTAPEAHRSALWRFLASLRGK